MRLMFLFRRKKRVYLDYAAATPLLPAVKAAMMPYFNSEFANPSSIHSEGRVARAAVEEARNSIAQTFEIRPEFVTFTGGGTEANNLAIRGTVMAARESGQDLSELEIITTRIEHPATLKTAEALERRGVQVRYVSVNEVGQIVLSDLEKTLSAKTVLVSVSYANSEIGTIQKLHTIKKTLRAAEEKFGTKIYLHVDAAQAPLWLNCQFDSLKADLVSFDASKCHGPKGVGILLRSPRTKLVPITYGGGQEDDLRPGTENVPGVVGAAKAIEAAQTNWKKRAADVATLRDAGIKNILRNSQAVLNGPTGDQRQANNINISIPGLDTEFATVVLDKHGFAVSTKSACAGAGGGESVVVREISNDRERALSTLRISLSPNIKKADLKCLALILKKHYLKMNKLQQTVT